jgi:outer membrane protein assembly factor BamB
MKPNFRIALRAVSILGMYFSFVMGVAGDDWPMWRYDANRSAASKSSLPEKLELQWSIELGKRTPTWDDPLNLDLMTFDRNFEPVVLDGRMFVSFNDSDKLMALDAATGKPIWSAFAEAPVRFPAVGWNEKIYFTSDDGYLYCVNASNGELLWKFFGPPNTQHAIGNRRLTSAWPARGGPVVRDGIVYFAASIWPFMGTFIYALDAESGTIRWVNNNTGSTYIKQPHSAPSFAGVAPQGALVATTDQLIVPGGRSVPAVFDRSNGKLKYFELNAGGKGTGGSFVVADDHRYYVHTRQKGTRAFDLAKGLKTAFLANEPVLHEKFLYSAEQNDEGQKFVRAYDALSDSLKEQEPLWEVEADGTGDLILVGDRLYAASESAISVIRLPNDQKSAKVVDQFAAPGPIVRLLAAHNRLFTVTSEGRIMAFGDPAKSTDAVSSSGSIANEAFQSKPEAIQRTQALLKSGSPEGFAFWFGPADSPLIEALAQQQPFVQLAVVDDDAARVDALRKKLDRAGLHGRTTVHLSAAEEFRPPSYVAHQVFVDARIFNHRSLDSLKKIYECVRPFGGVLHLLSEQDLSKLSAQVSALQLEQSRIDVGSSGITVRREGPLPGSANWTHQYGDMANTIKSDDRRVKLPLGILWFGGSSNMDVLPRHGHGPPEQVVDGRLFIQGMNSLSARDVYTGRILWKREFENLGTFDVYFDSTYEDTPLDPKYNQVHIPGANGRGTNYVVTSDRVYLLEGRVCHVLDAVSGKTLVDLTLPTNEAGEVPEWGFIGVYQDILLGGAGFAQYATRHQLTFEEDAKLSKSKLGFGSKSLDRAASLGLVAMDRHTGKVLWQAQANHSFWHNGIVAGNGMVFCLDRNPSPVEAAMKRRGLEMPSTYRIVAMDIKSGKVAWQRQENIFGSWLGYSEEHDCLLQAGALASDRLSSEVGEGMAVFRGRDGSVVWEKKDVKYAGPCILHNDLIITNTNSYKSSAGAFYLKTGLPKLVANPLTGESQPWTITRAYGCNNIIASENMLTFRSGAASFCDLQSDSGTGNLGGFKSGCTSNLVVANGVLNAPDYTRTCSCAYQNQTSLALVPMPDIEVWSVDSMAPQASTDKPIDRLAVNFAAPGDRRDAMGRLWLEYPVKAGDAPGLSIDINPEAIPFQFHSSTLSNSELPWVLASGFEGVTEFKLKRTLDKAIIVKLEDDDDDDESSSQKTQSAETKKASEEKKSTKSGSKNNQQKKSIAVASQTEAKKQESVDPGRYTLRLYFAAPSLLKGERRFDVIVQDDHVHADIALNPQGTVDEQVEILEMTNIVIGDELKIQLVPKQGLPVLNGLELIRN